MFLLLCFIFLFCYFLLGKAISVMMASGPFTTNTNLDYAPLRDLLNQVLTTKPDVLILMGPFVDISQPLIESGDVILIDTDDKGKVTEVAASYEMAFVKRIMTDSLQLLFDTEKDLPTNIILVPSLLDAHHEFVFPQPPFGDRDRVQAEFLEEPLGILKVPFSEDNNKKRVHLMPNPCMFR